MSTLDPQPGHERRDRPAALSEDDMSEDDPIGQKYLFAWAFRGWQRYIHLVSIEHAQEMYPASVCGQRMWRQALSATRQGVPAKVRMPCPKCFRAID